MPAHHASEIVIERFLDVPVAERDRVMRAIDAIFFEASSVKAFADDAARTAFRWLWLGRYLAEEPEHAFLARTKRGDTVGYLVGSLEDPAHRPEFSSLSYVQVFAGVTASYPAHLHINVAAGRREAGVGAGLIEAFAAHAARHGAPGMHVVTSAGARNTRFYDRCRFVELARCDRAGDAAVLLCRALGQR